MNINFFCILFFLQLSTVAFAQKYDYLFDVMNATGSISKVKIVALKSPNPDETLSQGYNYYGVIHDEKGITSTQISLVFCTTGAIIQEGVAEFFVKQSIGKTMDLCGAYYLVYENNKKIVETVNETPYPQSDTKDISPSRYYYLKRGENYSVAIMKMYLSRYYFNVIYSKSKNHNWLDFSKTKTELLYKGLYSY
jgi:hypothetical protein